jgi:hypothetical protein
LWYVYPDDQEIHVHAPGLPVKVLGIKDVLEGGKALPDFKLPLKDIFPTE